MEDSLQQLTAAGRIVAVESDQSALAASLEERAGLRLPASYREFISSYEFEPFEIGGVELYGNASLGEFDDLSVAPFKDKALHTPLLAAGFFAIGRPDCGSYDPICLNIGANPADPAVVRIDHEQMLCHGKVKILKEIAPSFSALARGCVA